MEFAAHYSGALADLIRAGRADVDRFKCPAWPELLPVARKLRPVYVHFPLRVGAGVGDAIDTETNHRADWAKVEALLKQTGTPLVNVHLGPLQEDHPHLPLDSTEPAHVEAVAEALIRDLGAVVARFGPDRVIAENTPDDDGQLRPALLPEVIRRVIEETGCGFLFDLSHARLAARFLGWEIEEYIRGLPVERIREIHLTGIQFFGDEWVERLRRAGIADRVIQPFAGRWTDHLPMTEEDWAVTGRAIEQVHTGAWGDPWVVAFEVGGVGPLWEALTDEKALAEQVPRLAACVQGWGAGGQGQGTWIPAPLPPRCEGGSPAGGHREKE